MIPATYFDSSTVRAKALLETRERDSESDGPAVGGDRIHLQDFPLAQRIERFGRKVLLQEIPTSAGHNSHPGATLREHVAEFFLSY